MIRTQVQLTEKQAEAIRRIARRRGASLAAVVRDAVEATIQAEERDRAWQRALAAVGSVRGGRGNVAEDHDRHLPDAYEG